MPAKKGSSSIAWSKSVEYGTKLIKVLENEETRRQLVDASDGVRSWAQARRADAEPRRRVDPIGSVTSRLGHQRLESRIGELFEVIPEFEAVRPEFAAELTSTEAELRRATAVTARLSPSKRMRARRDIYKRLDEIEEQLIDAILADDTPPSGDTEPS